MNERGRLFSLRRRLLLALLSAIALAWLAAAAYTYFDARHEINELLDAHLAQSASMIVAQVGRELEEIDLEHVPQLHKRSHHVAFQIWERGRTLRLHSANAPQGRLSEREEGFSNTVIGGKRWRVFSGWDGDRRLLVQVGERDETRRELATSIATNLLTPLLLALPALGLFVWFSIARALRPLRTLGRQVAERRPDNLTPLLIDGAPEEVAPLVNSLNTLLGRVSRLIENERRFTADAAHELRTPLAALKTQAQVARGATGDAERRRALDNVIAGCDRAHRLVEQLLTLARIEEPNQDGMHTELCDLRSLARQTVAELAPDAMARNIEIELTEGAPVTVDGYPGLIGIVLRNLIDNAVRYSPDGTTVRVDAANADDAARLTVTDEGPGIAPEECGKVGQRFYRILGSSQSGSGLGLSIVHRIAEIHEAALVLGAGPGGKGLAVTMTFRRRKG